MMTRDREMLSSLSSEIGSHVRVGNSISIEVEEEVCGNGTVGWLKVEAPTLLVSCVFVFLGGAGVFLVLVLFEGGPVRKKNE